ncbi:MAG: hypothetical protein HGA43_02275 [Nitrospirae bacterium]|nr:hypothetical protein [Nitrospirota bacterium]
MQFAAVIMLFIFLACAFPSTKFSSAWEDKTYQEHPERILVINAFPNPANRKVFEDEFVKALKERGVDAVVSYTIMPDPIVSDKNNIADEEAFRCCVQDVGADTVLISKPVGKRTGQFAGTDYVYENIVTQTDVYDIKSNRLALSVTAETRMQDMPYSALIKTYIKDLVNKLSQQGLLLKK